MATPSISFGRNNATTPETDLGAGRCHAWGGNRRTGLLADPRPAEIRYPAGVKKNLSPTAALAHQGIPHSAHASQPDRQPDRKTGTLWVSSRAHRWSGAGGFLADEASGFREWERAWPASGGSRCRSPGPGATRPWAVPTCCSREILSGFAAKDDVSAAGWTELELGYGLPAFGGGFTATPNLGVALSDRGRASTVSAGA